MNKKEYRKKAYEIRNSLTDRQVREFSSSIETRLLQHPCYRDCRTLFTYVSMEKEVHTHGLIEKALRDGKRVCVPRVVPGQYMEAVPIKSLRDDLKPGFFNVLEPVADLPPITPEEIELVIVPGLVFDREGYRIGYGGGYYDKYLQLIPEDCMTVGLVFHQLVADRIPREPHDRKVKLVITEKSVLE